MKKYNYLRVLITIVVVILGISGIAWFTWNIGKVFVGLVTAESPAPQEQAQSTANKILSLPELRLWTCQVGVYKDKQKADLLVESLRLKGWKAGIIKDDPYTIAIGAFSTKEKAVLLGNFLAKDGIEVWIKEEIFPALHYKVSGKNVERITVMLQLANSLLGGAEREKVKDELAGDMDFLISSGCPADFEQINNTLSTILSTDFVDNKNAYNEELLILYTNYKSITTKYLNITTPKS